MGPTPIWSAESPMAFHITKVGVAESQPSGKKENHRKGGGDKPLFYLPFSPGITETVLIPSEPVTLII